jgi:hypothetical protein
MNYTIRYKTGKPFGVFKSETEAHEYLVSHILDNPSAYGLELVDRHEFFITEYKYIGTPTFDAKHEIIKLKESILKGFLALEQNGEYYITVSEEVFPKPCSLVQTFEIERLNPVRVLRVWHFNRFFHKWISEIKDDAEYDSFIEACRETGRVNS